MSNISIEQVYATFVERFGTEPWGWSCAPGRLEILGNHTDYNEGYVLSTAVNRATFAVFGPHTQSSLALLSRTLGDPVSHFALSEVLEHHASSHWSDYIKGVLVEAYKRGLPLKGFQMVVDSQIPL
ncbi:MAG: galactokinase family protein, partial [Myxococcota bacterium]